MRGIRILNISWAIVFATLFHSYSAQTTSPSYQCSEFFVPVNVSAQTVQLNVTNPQNQFELTNLLTQMAYTNATIDQDVTIGPATVNDTFNIWSQLCIPNDFAADGVVEFTAHGSTFNHTYWNFRNGTGYNYAEAALRSGHAIFMYDGLGEGASDKPDGIQKVQIGTEIAVAVALVKQLPSLLSFGKIVGVGHAHGSVVLIAALAQEGNLFDATVLTSISSTTAGLSAGLAGMDIEIATEAAPEIWQNLESSYAVTGGFTNDQIGYYLYPFFDTDVFVEMQSGRGLVTLGVLLTLPANSVAQEYTNPVLVVTGDHDFFMCGGVCDVAVGDFPSMPATVQSLFPSASNFTVMIPENTGHVMFMHLSGPDIIQSIQDWMDGTV
ncbi:alpha/beta-hydrolase [Dendrothele bispora CBS 962.96]|uniref:Alpha/beta-hydrolase n=1 Tax=Dendrothele bispora (strain CBS 962.96) TaxID=1314807 RepID=A0A4S8MAN8_DENBC|nr:alpha/beta-hydrolase [Dendrothele bispora CBS 962.96]